MATRLYDAAALGLASGSYDWAAGTWKVTLLSSLYTFSSAHDFYNDLTGVIATATLSSRTVAMVSTKAVWDAADPSFTGVAAGSTALAAVIWKDTGSTATSPLFLHTEDLHGLPFTTTGTDFIIAWSDGPSKIIAIPTLL